MFSIFVEMGQTFHQLLAGEVFYVLRWGFSKRFSSHLDEGGCRHFCKLFSGFVFVELREPHKGEHGGWWSFFVWEGGWPDTWVRFLLCFLQQISLKPHMAFCQQLRSNFSSSSCFLVQARCWLAMWSFHPWSFLDCHLGVVFLGRGDPNRRS